MTLITKTLAERLLGIRIYESKVKESVRLPPEASIKNKTNETIPSGIAK